jgi:hypothetical protein
MFFIIYDVIVKQNFKKRPANHYLHARAHTHNIYIHTHTHTHTWRRFIQEGGRSDSARPRLQRL